MVLRHLRQHEHDVETISMSELDIISTDTTGDIWPWRCRVARCRQTAFSGEYCGYHRKVRLGLLEVSKDGLRGGPQPSPAPIPD
jgi:hypothetical protein